MNRLEVLERKPIPSLNPLPTRLANTTFNAAKGRGPIEGRPPGEDWAHQRWDEFYPQVGIEVTQLGARINAKGAYATSPCRPSFHYQLPDQRPEALWTLNGTFPPKLVLGRYGEPILLRHHNGLPPNRQNYGFGQNTITTHEHNGHHGGENDGFAAAFFFPGQFYDYHWPIVLAGHDSINTYATDPKAGGPDDSGGIIKVPGDYRETMSTHWFHDHMLDFTAQNVYKGMAGMFNIYSALDRGNEEIDDGVNLRLPSGTGKSWGNLDYDVNLMLADKAWDRDGQLAFDIFQFDGFLGDVMTVNLLYKPYFEVERRKYRFRILNSSVSRFFKICLSDHAPFWMVANDGNLMEHPVLMTELDEQGIAERYDIVIDFSRYSIGDKVWMVNLCEHEDGTGPADDLTLAQALSGRSGDPCVGKFLEFRIARDPAKPDLSLTLSANTTLIPLPARVPIRRERTFVFGDSGSDKAPWTIQTDGGPELGMDPNRISAAPHPESAEIWHLINDGGGWDHPVHIHFEEGQILSRDGGARGALAPHERFARKDVYRLHPDGSVTLYMRFREFYGLFMEHCHNTQHEDHAMLLRWDVDRGLVPMPTPVPTEDGVTFLTPEILSNRRT